MVDALVSDGIVAQSKNIQLKSFLDEVDHLFQSRALDMVSRQI